MKLDLGILVGAESKAWLVELTKLIERVEKLVANGAQLPAAESDDEEEAPKPKRGRPPKAKLEEEESESDDDTEEDEDDDFAPKAKKSKAAEAFDDDEEEESESDDDTEEDEEEDEEPAKPAKKKKVTADDVNDACKAKVKALTKEGKSGADARKMVVKLLKKNFDVTSVTDLEPEQYAKAIKVMS